MTDAPEMAVWSKEDGMESAGAITPCKGPPEYIRLDTHEAVVAERDKLLETLNTADELRTATMLGYSEDLERLEAERKRLVAALVQCREEIDYYIRQEYPGDHPIHERYRKRDLSANPARIALEDKG